MEALKQFLDDDKPVKIYTEHNKHNPALTVPRSVLSNISTILDEVIVASNSTCGNDYIIELHGRPEDVKAWEVFIFWAYERQLPHCDEIANDHGELGDVWVHTWLLASTFGIIELQDLVMLQLIALCSEVDFNMCTVKLALSRTRPESLLRLLMLDEIAAMLDDRNRLTWSDLHGLSMTQGFADELLEALQRHQFYGYPQERLSVTPSDGTPLWKRYLIGEGPSKHWIFDKQ